MIKLIVIRIKSKRNMRVHTVQAKVSYLWDLCNWMIQVDRLESAQVNC